MDNNRLLETSRSWLGQLTEWRRDFHRNPELGYEEHRTAGIVVDHLRSLGLETRTGIGKTGVVGLLRGQEPGPTFLLRADMDALPIPDGKPVLYRSTVQGKAHLCGHDAHTAMLMGAAKLLAERGLPRGNVKFMFQPAEEGGAGAKAMVEDGVLQDPKVDAAAALHVSPFCPVGKITVSKGPAWAATDSLRIKIIGKGGHAAGPHHTVDSIPIAAQVITALQQIVSRQVDPLDSAVVTIGKINGGHAVNAIASEVELLGTVRTLNPKLREQMRVKVEAIVKGVTEAFGAGYELELREGYPIVVNDDSMYELFTRTAGQVMGSESWDLINPTMGGEDFAFVAQQVPSVMFRLGVCGGEETAYPLHHPLFDLDESAMPFGSALLAAIAINYLEAHP
ncbi:M20 family metallopeptidase [Paenibacillus aurantius]|uniref:M20 family metallopeptidase n=1 Tax=Paenibacillus aurantius TaxID=2918900 RepID=A0AA96LI46_9BACL|nr:M20 family metallopeptidase [Paenibacillus aurantius]WNQ12545.1 M20 family metallopeptidase [Paenibacillus aurantius]